MKNFDIKISFSIMALLIILVGIFQSWGVALSILNLMSYFGCNVDGS